MKSYEMSICVNEMWNISFLYLIIENRGIVFTFFWYLKIVNLLLARRILHISFWWVLAPVLKSFRGRTNFERGMTLDHTWEGHHQEQKLCKGEGLLRLYESLGEGGGPPKWREPFTKVGDGHTSDTSSFVQVCLPNEDH